MPIQVPDRGESGGGPAPANPNLREKPDKYQRDKSEGDDTRGDRERKLDADDPKRMERATKCGPGLDDLAEQLRDVFRRAKEEGLSRETLKDDLKEFFAKESGHKQLTEADRQAIFELIDERLDKGMRCGDWYSMDDLPTMNDRAAGAKGERFVGQFVRGMMDSLNQYVEMHFSNVIGQDHYYHCVAHCDASSRGPGGQLASKLVGYLRESTDAIKNRNGRGGARHAVIDSFVDSYVNRIGYGGSQSGTRCNVQCARLKPNGMR